MPETVFHRNQRTGDDREWPDSSQVGSQVLNDIGQELLFSELEPLAGQVDVLVGTPAEKRLEVRLQLAQPGGFIFRRFEKQTNVTRYCCAWRW